MSNEREAAYKACPETNCDWGAFLRGFQAGAKWQRSQSAPAGWPTDDMVVRGAEELHDSLRMFGIDINFDTKTKGTEIQQEIVEAVFNAMIAAAPKADVQCPAYSERIVPAPTALIRWAWEDEPESTLFDEGYNAARRWVKMQLEYAVSKAPQPVSDDVAKDALEKRLDSARQLLICISATQPEWEPQISEWMMGSKGDE